MNSKIKGAAGERELANKLILHGFNCRRGQSDGRFKPNGNIFITSENAYNSKIRNNNTSGCTGVWYRKDTKKWTAAIKNKYKKINLGCFEKKEDAIKARIEAEKKYSGEFRRSE